MDEKNDSSLTADGEDRGCSAETKAAATQTAWEITLYSKYLGLAALCGRIVRYGSLAADDRDSLDRAFVDVNAILEKRSAGIRFQRSTPGSYAAFDHVEKAEGTAPGNALPSTERGEANPNTKGGN